MTSNGSTSVAAAVTTHTSTVAATHDPSPRMLSPWVSTEARIIATSVETNPIPPKNADAYRLAILKMNGDRMACATENTTTATTNPDTVTETPGISNAATSNPIADDARNTTPRSRSRTMATIVRPMTPNQPILVMRASPSGMLSLEASIFDALIPLFALAVLIGASLALFGLKALDGPIQVGLILCCAVAALIALKNGHNWTAVQEAGQGAMSSITSAIFILLAVGALIGSWNLSGTIPTLVYYGIQVLSPGYYYVAAAVICGVVAMSIGSSWTTAGTIGVGLVGIATMLGVSSAITAAAVVSGAYLGDKLSPLSETTILTARR